MRRRFHKKARTRGKRQYLGSAIRMLRETEHPAKVWLYRVVVFRSTFRFGYFRRSSRVGINEVWKALAGQDLIPHLYEFLLFALSPVHLATKLAACLARLAQRILGSPSGE